MVWLFVWPWAGGMVQKDRQCLHTNPAGAAETGSPVQAKRFHYLCKTGSGGDRSIRKELHMWLIEVPTQQFMADYISAMRRFSSHESDTLYSDLTA